MITIVKIIKNIKNFIKEKIKQGAATSIRGLLIGALLTYLVQSKTVEQTYDLNNKPVLYFESGSFLDCHFIDYFKCINPNISDDECSIDLYSLSDYWYDENGKLNITADNKFRKSYKYAGFNYSYEDSIKTFEKLDLQEFYCNHSHKPYIIDFNLPNNRVKSYQINGNLDFVEGLYHDKAVGIYSVSNDGGKIASNVKVMFKKDDIFKICKSFENDYINVNLENECIQSITYKGF